MNEKIVIIGNGFDLRHFLPTKYNHLITILREIERLNENCTSVSFYDLFSSSFKDNEEWFYNNICKFYNTNLIVFDVNNIKSIQNRLVDNKWYQYLKTVEDSKIETWIDFETEINRVLVSIDLFFDEYERSPEDRKLGAILDDKNNCICFGIENDDYKRVFKNKLYYNTLVNFHLFICHGEISVANPKYVLELEGEMQYFREKKFFDFLYNELEKFIGIFNDYIVSIITPFYNHFIEEKKDYFIKNEGNFLFKNVNRIVSFNYTQTFSELYKEKDIISNTINKLLLSYPEQEYIHGKSNPNWGNNTENLEIVLGVSDISDYLKKQKLFQFTKYFQKLHKRTDYLFLNEVVEDVKLKKHASGKDFQNRTFYFWGHSLDSSDGDYIKEVFYIVENTESTICVFYHSISGKADQLKNLLNIIHKDIIEHLMKDKRLKFVESTFENLYAELA
ncbi:AbiH family protein [Elizabethkingia meningoseptica]|uniref:AbiH family protein n=1 Tax=Elizabethkingia meningoseptica TaxID=238 RepID=UPI00201154E4|nr:AbiH family protein [Elizabethkingia meningoseptica]MCL1676256.1 bacteriophage abortive infection AbiH family protein [Elizabethkingia meningoseptica]MCL1687730.1 bacteriophage abortive infection AbiH family protein [Elizabethkingia meningoseptica]